MVRRKLIALVILTFLIHPLEASAASSNCEAPDMLIVLDKSGSMDGVKWTSARNAIDAILTSWESAVSFGLLLYPTSGSCALLPISPNVDVGVAVNNRSAILAQLPATSTWPSGNTPMHTALIRAHDYYESMADPTRRHFILFITDGQPNCSDNGTVAKATITDMNLVHGIKTFVVGFGSGVGATLLTEFAQAAGTARSGTPAYYQADNQAELQTAIGQIVNFISKEICDGKDNNCDGRTDEAVVGSCETVCGRGRRSCRECGPGTGVNCDIGGTWNDDCDAVPLNACGTCGPAPVEMCDGQDNNCDSLIDEGAVCPTGELCLCGQCAPPCSNGGCASGRSCVNGYCVLDGCCGRNCGNAVCTDGGCIDPCADGGVNCPPGSICRQGQCVAPDCFHPSYPCTAGQYCVDGGCVNDLCYGVNCPQGQFCRNGICINACSGVVCPNGHTCRDGVCHPIPCGGPCPVGYTCLDGGCSADPCYSVSCPANLVCINGMCIEDICRRITCPPNQVCQDGQCFSPGQLVEDGGPAAPDGGPAEDGGAVSNDGGPAGDGGAASNDGGGGPADGGTVQPLRHGCSCGLSSGRNGGPSGLLFLLALLPLLILRRRHH